MELRRGGGATGHLLVPGLPFGRRRLLFGVGSERAFCIGLAPLLIIDEKVDAGNPKIPRIPIIRPQLIDTFLGDQLKLYLINHLNVFDFLDGDALLNLL